MTRQRLLVLGSGPMAIEIADLAEDASWVVTGFVENLDRSRCAEPLDGRTVYWIDDVDALADSHLAVVGLGTTRRGRLTEEAAARGLGFATIVHPSAHVSRRAVLGPGCVISAVAAIAAGARLGEHVIVNRGASVGHHSVVGAQTSVMPGAIVSGLCVIGDRTWIGAGAVVVDRVTVGSDTMVTAGSVVSSDLPDRVLAAGSPARVVKRDHLAR